MLANLLFVASVLAFSQGERRFEVDWGGDRLLKDGEPFSYVSGSMHYFRVPRPYWRDRMLKMKAAGLNTLCTYVEWSSHERSPGRFDFSGDNDLEAYIELAAELGLLVILRPGPYICAEREFGGYPAWLLTQNPNVKLRTSDPSYTYFVQRWLDQLMKRMTPLLYGNGGPIIMVQVENEYGSYPVHDKSYLTWLRDVFNSHVAGAAVLFTTDGPGSSYIARGRIPGVLSTIDFGPSNMAVNKTFSPLRALQPHGPLINSEYYVGWLSYWGEPFPNTATQPILRTMQDMLNNNVSFNMYMFHGGTNFAFTAGSGSDKTFQSDLTSYDYDAPISEGGELTDKYFAIRDLLSKYYPVDAVPEVGKKANYGQVQMEPVVSLWDSPVGLAPVQSPYPLSFEQLDQAYGFMAYNTTVVVPTDDPSVLQATVRDRAIVYLNKEEVAVLQYTIINETPLPPTLEEGQELLLLVENLGRRNFKLMSDCTKGLVSNLTVDGVTIEDWTMVGYPLEGRDIVQVESLPRKKSVKLPAFFSGQFTLPKGAPPADTYVDMTGWGKGVLFVNGFNLGRYWHVGPQMTLYLPGVYIRAWPANNTVTLLELHYTNRGVNVDLTDTPRLNATTNAIPST